MSMPKSKEALRRQILGNIRGTKTHHLHAAYASDGHPYGCAVCKRLDGATAYFSNPDVKLYPWDER